MSILKGVRMFEYIFASIVALSHFGFVTFMHYQEAKKPREVTVCEYNTSYADFKSGKNMVEKIE